VVPIDGKVFASRIRCGLSALMSTFGVGDDDHRLMSVGGIKDGSDAALGVAGGESDDLIGGRDHLPALPDVGE